MADGKELEPQQLNLGEVPGPEGLVGPNLPPPPGGEERSEEERLNATALMTRQDASLAIPETKDALQKIEGNCAAIAEHIIAQIPDEAFAMNVYRQNVMEFADFDASNPDDRLHGRILKSSIHVRPVSDIIPFLLDASVRIFREPILIEIVKPATLIQNGNKSDDRVEIQLKATKFIIQPIPIVDGEGKPTTVKLEKIEVGTSFASISEKISDHKGDYDMAARVAFSKCRRDAVRPHLQIALLKALYEKAKEKKKVQEIVLKQYVKGVTRFQKNTNAGRSQASQAPPPASHPAGAGAPPSSRPAAAKPATSPSTATPRPAASAAGQPAATQPAGKVAQYQIKAIDDLAGKAMLHFDAAEVNDLLASFKKPIEQLTWNEANVLIKKLKPMSEGKPSQEG